MAQLVRHRRNCGPVEPSRALHDTSGCEKKGFKKKNFHHAHRQERPAQLLPLQLLYGHQQNDTDYTKPVRIVYTLYGPPTNFRFQTTRLHFEWILFGEQSCSQFFG